MPDQTMTPAAWLAFLSRKLDDQQRMVTPFINYYDGVHRLAWATERFKAAFGRYFGPTSNNWMRLVVDAPVPRLKVRGWRVDPDDSFPLWDQEADREAWAIWKANDMQTHSAVAHTEAIKCGVVNVLVSPPLPDNPRGADMPILSIETADCSYVYMDPLIPRMRRAAIKRWVDDTTDIAYATVYLPDAIHKWESSKKVNGQPFGDLQWRRRSSDPGGPNPYRVVPMVPLENKVDPRHGGRSDLEDAVPIQDSINKLCLDLLVTSEFHAYPARWASGWEHPNDPVTGKPMTQEQMELLASQGRMFRATSPETEFGSFPAADLRNYTQTIEMFVDHLAAVTQTPAYYLKGKMANLSASAIRAADSGLNDRSTIKQWGFGDGWEEVMRTSFIVKGGLEQAHAHTIETVWEPVDRPVLSQVIDGAVKLRQSLSAPVEMVWEEIGWSPEKIRMAKSMMNLPASPAAVAAQGGGGGSTENPTAGGVVTNLPEDSDPL